MRATRRPRAVVRPARSSGTISARHLDPTAFPSLVLAVRLRQRVRHLRQDDRVRCVRHEVALEEQLVLELSVLDEVTGPAAAGEQRTGEHHAVAVQTRRSTETAPPEGAEVVAARQRREAEVGDRREVGVANRVVPLRGLHASLHLLVHRTEKTGGDGGVGVDDHDRVERFAACDEPIEQPVECWSFPRVVRGGAFVHSPAAPPHNVRGVVTAVVRDDVYRGQLGRVVDRFERVQRLLDARGLIVCGYEDRESRRWCGGLVCLDSTPAREQASHADHEEVRARQRGDSSSGYDEACSCRPHRAM